jgi:hypothetical protein
MRLSERDQAQSLYDLYLFICLSRKDIKKGTESRPHGCQEAWEVWGAIKVFYILIMMTVKYTIHLSKLINLITGEG